MIIIFQIRLHSRVLLANIWLQENDLSNVTSDCCSHILMETCLHDNTPAQAVAFDVLSHVTPPLHHCSRCWKTLLKVLNNVSQMSKAAGCICENVYMFLLHVIISISSTVMSVAATCSVYKLFRTSNPNPTIC